MRVITQLLFVILVVNIVFIYLDNNKKEKVDAGKIYHDQFKIQNDTTWIWSKRKAH
jgi:hypothetical protein